MLFVKSNDLDQQAHAGSLRRTLCSLDICYSMSWSKCESAQGVFSKHDENTPI